MTKNATHKNMDNRTARVSLSNCYASSGTRSLMLVLSVLMLSAPTYACSILNSVDTYEALAKHVVVERTESKNTFSINLLARLEDTYDASVSLQYLGDPPSAKEVYDFGKKLELEKVGARLKGTFEVPIKAGYQPFLTIHWPLDTCRYFTGVNLQKVP